MQQSKVASVVNVFIVDSCSCGGGNVTVTVHDVPSKASYVFLSVQTTKATLSLPGFHLNDAKSFTALIFYGQVVMNNLK